MKTRHFVFDNWKRNWGLQITTALVLSACAFLVSGSLLLTGNLQSILTMWGEESVVTVYLQSDLSIEQKDEVESFLRSLPDVSEVSYVSQQQALEEFKQRMVSFAPDLLSDPELASVVPPSFHLALRQLGELASDHLRLRDLADRIATQAFVEDISYGQEWVQAYGQVTQIAAGMGIFIILVILLCSLFVMGNAVRQSIEQRRDEIGILELVGATNAMIRRPFVIEAAMLAGAAAGIALLVSYLGFMQLRGWLASELSYLGLAGSLQFFSPIQLIAFTALFMAIGAFGAYLCVRNINTGWAALEKDL